MKYYKLIIITLLAVVFTSCYNSNFSESINQEQTNFLADPPAVQILTPAEGEYISVYKKNSTVTPETLEPENLRLSGIANDSNTIVIDSPTSYRWTSSVNGFLGIGRDLEISTEAAALTPGDHVITLEVTDLLGKVNTASVSIHVPEVYVEDFSTSANNAAAVTTGVWDTVNGTAYLDHKNIYDIALLSTAPETGVKYLNYTISGNYIFMLGDNSTVYKYDLSSLPRFNYEDTILNADLNSSIYEINNIQVFNDFLYATNYSKGELIIIDWINNIPYKLTGIGRPYDLCIYKNSDNKKYALIPTGYTDDSFLRIADVTDPSSITIVKDYKYFPSGNNYIYSVALKEKYLFLAYNNIGLLVLDMSNPSNPAFVAKYDTGITNEIITDIQIDGNNLYTLYHNQQISRNGLLIFDISDAFNPAIIGKYEDTNHPVLLGNVTYGSANFCVMDNKVYIANTDNKIICIDVSKKDSSDPANKMILPCFSRYYNSGAVKKLLSYDDKVFILNDEGINYIDKKYSLPGIVSSFNVSGKNIAAVVTENNRAVVATSDELIILDTTNISSPKRCGSYKEDGVSFNTTNYIINRGTDLKDYIYIANGDNGLLMLDISDPYNPIKITTPSIAGYSYITLAVYNNNLFIGAKNISTDKIFLIKYDITNPLSINPGTPVSLPDLNSIKLTASNNYVYCMDLNNLSIVDYGNTNSVKNYILSNIGFQSNWGVEMNGNVVNSGNYVYYTNSHGLNCVNISNPDNPVLAFSEVINVGQAGSVAVANNFAYVTLSGPNVAIYDVGTIDPLDPNKIIPKYLSKIVTNYAWGIIVNEDYLYITNGAAGLITAGVVKEYSYIYNDNEQYIQFAIPDTADVTACRIKSLFQLNNQFLSLELSNNNGTTWIPAGDNVRIEFPSAPVGGLLWRAKMRTFNQYETPVIDRTAVEYWTD